MCNFLHFTIFSKKEALLILTVFDSLRELTLVSLALRLLLAIAGGGIIGMERQRKSLPAGFRTHILVCMGSALTMLLGQYDTLMLTTRWAELREQIGIGTDFSRFGAQVINGIGFLAAGTILVSENRQVRGLTTAAGLWASACMGLAIGAGFYECVIVVLPLMFLCMRVFPRVDQFLQERAPEMNIYIQFESTEYFSAILAHVKKMNVQVLGVDVFRQAENKHGFPAVLIHLKLRSRVRHSLILAQLARADHIRSIEEI